MTDLPTLIEAMCQGTATHADRDRLEQLLRDPANRAEYLSASRLHSELLWRWNRGRIHMFGGSNGRRAGAASGLRTAADHGNQPRRQVGSSAALVALRHATETMVAWLRRQAAALMKPLPFSLLLAGSLMAMTLLVAASVPVPRVDSTIGGDRVAEASITGLHEAKWRAGTSIHGLYDTLPTGAVLALESGLAEIFFDCGAKVVLEGPAVLRVEGRSASRLDRGRLTAKLEKTGRKAAHGRHLPRLFTIHTPKASVHDLGTEFGVEVRAAGDADVHVFDGLVEMAAMSRPGVAASATREPALRLAAGESAKIDEAGRITASDVAASRRFVRSLPRAPKPVANPVAEIPWNDATAEILYRDTFLGSGPLHGTTPASRGGVGTAAWQASPASWGSLESAGDKPGLNIAGGGHALLPFRPEVGFVYNFTVTLDVTAGGGHGLAFGMRADIPSKYVLNVANMGQRHDCSQGDGVCKYNAVFPGPGNEKRILSDQLAGLQTRAVLLDTSGRRWRVEFQVGGRRLAAYDYPENPIGVEQIGLMSSQAPEIRGVIRSLTLARNKAGEGRDP